MQQKWFQRFSKFALVYTIAVILFGAFVRATGSGAGCGEHWPTCQGEIIPPAPSIKTMIEFGHRLTSGLSLLVVVSLYFWSRQIFPKDHPARKAALYSVIFIFGEALVGAVLVLMALVDQNSSPLRAAVIAAHLVNTFLLLYWQIFVVEAASRADDFLQSSLSMNRNKSMLRNLFYGLCGLGFVAASGGIVALGDTLFPATGLIDGFKTDLSPTAHFLIRLRIVHPIAAVAVAIFLVMQCLTILRLKFGKLPTIRALVLMYSLIGQLIFGTVNLLLLAPVWAQLIHLLIADIIWITAVLLYLSLKFPEFSGAKDGSHGKA
ncbi:MAG: COX15/CtaA family protein [Proteobacteria bacterium]|nr:COX15/CtaA family protein [Pseudomonadota bacterium]